MPIPRTTFFYLIANDFVFSLESLGQDSNESNRFDCTVLERPKWNPNKFGLCEPVIKGVIYQ